MLRIGHKGADAIAPGNTLESFAAAVDAGVEVIELDVLRPQSDFGDGRGLAPRRGGPGRGRRAAGRSPTTGATPAGATRSPSTSASTRSRARRWTRVRFDLDLKIAGREDEVVAALADRGLIERAMVSTMEVESLVYLRDAAPELDRGWTLPKVSRDWSRSPWLRPVFLAGSASLRARLPGLVRTRAPELGVWAVWVYHPLITGGWSTRRTRSACGDRLDGRRRRSGSSASKALDVDGICTNDPRLLQRLAALARLDLVRTADFRSASREPGGRPRRWTRSGRARRRRRPSSPG